MASVLEKLFTSRTRVAVFELLIPHKDGMSLREIARQAGASAPSAKKELENLRALGILHERKEKNRRIFEANRNSLFYDGLKLIFERAHELKKIETHEPAIRRAQRAYAEFEH